MKNFFKAFGFMLLIGVIYLAVNTGIGIIIVVVEMLQMGGGLNIGMMTEIILEQALLITIISNIVTIGILFLIFLARKDSFLSYVDFSKPKLMDVIKAILLGISLNLLVSPIVTWAMTYAPQSMIERYAEAMESILGGSSIILILIAVVVSAPLFEEILLRGIVFNDFKKAVPLWVAILIQALAFAVFHGNFIQGAYAFVVGVIFGIVYHKYKSIWIPIAMHFAFNSTSLVVATISEIALGEEGTIGVSIVQVILGIIGCAVMALWMKKTYVVEDYKVCYSEGD